MAYVAAEVRSPQRNILRALVLGVLAVATIYVGVNLAFLHALGLAGVAASGAVAADVAALGLGDWGRRGIAALICVSTLGAINGMIFTGARIYYAMGRDHSLFALVGQWSVRFGTPVWSLLIQAATTLLAVIGFGVVTGGPDGAGFQRLIDFTTPVFWFFLLLSGVSLIALRINEPAHPRPFRVPFYPVVPALFCSGAAGIVYAGVLHAIEGALLGRRLGRRAHGPRSDSEPCVTTENGNAYRIEPLPCAVAVARARPVAHTSGTAGTSIPKAVARSIACSCSCTRISRNTSHTANSPEGFALANAPAIVGNRLQLVIQVEAQHVLGLF